MTPDEIAQAAARRSIIPWSGVVWRGHNPRYRADDTHGSRLFRGRYNRGLDLYPTNPDWDALFAAGAVWEALYTGLSFGICLAELLRHMTTANLRVKLKTHLTQLRVDLTSVLDCTDIAALGIPEAEIFHDTDYSAGQALAAAARARNCEGILTPSAARIPGEDACNLILFPDKLRSGSVIHIVRTVVPNLGAAIP